MRKRLYHFYNILASYPVIALLLAGFVGLFYVARQYRPVELQRQAMYLQQIELKQELKALQKELTGIEQTDLRRRYMLFNDEFLKPADAQAEAGIARGSQLLLRCRDHRLSRPAVLAEPHCVLVQRGQQLMRPHGLPLVGVRGPSEPLGARVQPVQRHRRRGVDEAAAVAAERDERLGAGRG